MAFDYKLNDIESVEDTETLNDELDRIYSNFENAIEAPTDPAEGDVLTFDGTDWVAEAPAAGGSGITELTGDVTAGPGSGSQAATIASNAVTNGKLRDSGALSVIGRSANSSGDPADISATAATDAVLRESGSTIGFGTVATAGIANNAVTYAKIQDVSAASKLLGRGASGGSGDPEEITLGSGLSMSGTTLSASGGGGSDWDTTITKAADDSVTNSVTLVNDSELQFSTVAAGAIWAIEVFLLYSGSSSAADIRVDFAVAAGTMHGSFIATHVSPTGTPTTTTVGADDVNNTGDVTAATDSASSDAKIHVLMIRGSFRASNNTTFNLRFAQSTAIAASTTKTRIGSFMRNKRLL